jgi:hypothetical protein
MALERPALTRTVLPLLFTNATEPLVTLSFLVLKLNSVPRTEAVAEGPRMEKSIVPPSTAFTSARTVPAGITSFT